MRVPSPDTTWLNITTFVFGVIASAKSFTTPSGPSFVPSSRRNSFTTIPNRFALSRHGEMQPPCS